MHLLQQLIMHRQMHAHTHMQRWTDSRTRIPIASSAYRCADAYKMCVK